MRDWKSLLNIDRTEWLLEPSDPSVRYRSLNWLLDRAENDPELDDALEAVRAAPPARRLISSQRPEGYWGRNPVAHLGTRGELHLLHWLGYKDGPESTAKKATSYLAAGCLDEGGAYRYEMAKTRRWFLLPCHGAELARFMLRFGLTRDPRLRKLVDWLMSLRKADGALPCPSKAASPSCLFATALFMRLAEELRGDPEAAKLPAKVKTSIEEATKAAAELILEGGFARAARNKPTDRWFNFGFPLQWESDVLELLRLVGPYADGFDDSRLAETIELVRSKELADGSWPCEKEPKGGKWMRRYVDLDHPGESSKWVTLAVYRALKAVGKLATRQAP